MLWCRVIYWRKRCGLQTLQGVYRSLASSMLIAFLLFFRYRQPSSVLTDRGVRRVR